MPFQSAFTLGIIGGCFCAIGGLLGGLNYLYEGKRERAIMQDYFSHRLDQRDKAIKQVYGSNID